MTTYIVVSMLCILSLATMSLWWMHAEEKSRKNMQTFYEQEIQRLREILTQKGAGNARVSEEYYLLGVKYANLLRKLAAQKAHDDSVG